MVRIHRQLSASVWSLRHARLPGTRSPVPRMVDGETPQGSQNEYHDLRLLSARFSRIVRLLGLRGRLIDIHLRRWDIYEARQNRGDAYCDASAGNRTGIEMRTEIEWNGRRAGEREQHQRTGT